MVVLLVSINIIMIIVNLPDAISNDCSKCTERQQQGANKVMHYIIDHRPDDWEKLEKKYVTLLHSDMSIRS